MGATRFLFSKFFDETRRNSDVFFFSSAPATSVQRKNTRPAGILSRFAFFLFRGRERNKTTNNKRTMSVNASMWRIYLSVLRLIFPPKTPLFNAHIFLTLKQIALWRMLGDFWIVLVFRIKISPSNAIALLFTFRAPFFSRNNGAARASVQFFLNAVQTSLTLNSGDKSFSKNKRETVTAERTILWMSIGRRGTGAGMVCEPDVYGMVFAAKNNHMMKMTKRKRIRVIRRNSGQFKNDRHDLQRLSETTKRKKSIFNRRRRHQEAVFISSPPPFPRNRWKTSR